MFGRRFADIDQSLRRQMEQAGDVEGLRELPKRVKLSPYHMFYFRAFLDLDTERAHTNGLVKIPRSKIAEYADECGLIGDDKYNFIYVIRSVDDAHVLELAKETPQQSDGKPS